MLGLPNPTSQVLSAIDSKKVKETIRAIQYPHTYIECKEMSKHYKSKIIGCKQP